MLEDISCDSDYMLRVMSLIGIATRDKMPWVPQDETIYLVMDNAGGHGTEEAIGQYTRWMQREFNIKIIFQAARSPEVNALNLRLWMSIKSWVKKQHFHKKTTADALAALVKEAWQHLPSSTITKVFDRIPIVLQIIIDDQGRNDRVEMRRGQVVVAGEQGQGNFL
jgi:hypothetical protein